MKWGGVDTVLVRQEMIVEGKKHCMTRLDPGPQDVRRMCASSQDCVRILDRSCSYLTNLLTFY
jgi:hypothetical protein